MKCLIRIDCNCKEEDMFRGYVTIIFGDILKLSYIAILENPYNKQLSLMMPRFISDEKDEDGVAMNKEIISIHSREFRNELLEIVTSVYEDKEKKLREIDVNSIKSLNKCKIKVKNVGDDFRRVEATINFNNIFSINNINIGRNMDVIMPTYTIKNGRNYKIISSEVCNFIDEKVKKRIYNALALKGSICLKSSIFKLLKNLAEDFI